MTLEMIQNKRKRLIFRSWHRGTKEMDLLLGTFADKHVMTFSEDELVQYETMLQINDPDLYRYKTGKDEVPANIETNVFKLFMDHKYVAP